MRKGLRGSKESILPYKRLSAFFALGSKRLNARAAEWKQEDILPTIVHGIIADIAIVLAHDSEPTSSSPELTPSMWAELFMSLTRIGDELVDYNNRHMAAIKDANGPQAMGDTLEVIAATFARRSDVDSCKMWMDQIARYMCVAMNSKNEDLGKQLEKIVGVLKTLELNKKSRSNVLVAHLKDRWRPLYQLWREMSTLYAAAMIVFESRSH